MIDMYFLKNLLNTRTYDFFVNVGPCLFARSNASDSAHVARFWHTCKSSY